MKNIFCLIILFVFTNCNTATTPKNTTAAVLNKFDFNKLIGNWKLNTEFEAYEVWNKVNDSTYNSASLIILAANDTTVPEYVTLNKINNKWLYTVVVTEQNNGSPVAFQCTQSTQDSVIFENKKHDFPQLIKYKMINDSALVATIAGQTDTEYKIINFIMKKKK